MPNKGVGEEYPSTSGMNGIQNAVPNGPAECEAMGAENASPENASPQNVSPQNVSLQNGIPQDAIIQNGVAQDAVPQDAVLQDAFPQDAVPHAVLQDAFPQNAVPQDAVPQDAVPQDAVPQDAAPQDALLENAVPQDANPEPALPDGNEAGDEAGAQAAPEAAGAQLGPVQPMTGRGRCKWFNVTKGWGFIKPERQEGEEELPDIFVHQKTGACSKPTRDNSMLNAMQILQDSLRRLWFDRDADVGNHIIDHTQYPHNEWSVIRREGFRSLSEQEEVEFEYIRTERGLEATRVTGPNGAECVGASRVPVNKKKFRRTRCYNCGEIANHIAARCPMERQPKRCHKCKSEDHLIAQCPNKNGSSSSSRNGDRRHPPGPHDDPDNQPGPSGAGAAGPPAAKPEQC